MKKFTLCFIFFISIKSYSQTTDCNTCYDDKGISTNPSNPQNCELSQAFPSGLINPFLNTWNWAAIENNEFAPIPLNPNAGWLVPDYYNSAAPLNMGSPFYQGFLRKPAFIPLNDYDFHWQDGWELLWRNTGYFPNGQQYQTINSNSIVSLPTSLSQRRIPYIVLYNRYTGKMRLFFNVFAELNSYDHINLDIGYTNKALGINTSGLFRVGGGIEKALDQKTIINVQSAHFENFNDVDNWFMTEIQTAYDPCICNYSSDIRISLTGISSSTLDLTGRSISTTMPLRDVNGKPTYTDFLNINTKQENNNAGSGLAIYTTLDGMLSDYDKELKEYKDNLSDYNSIGNTALRSLMGLGKVGLNAGLTGLVPSSILTGLTSNAIRVIYKNTKPSSYNTAKQWAYDQTQPIPYKLVSISSKPEGQAAYENMVKDAEKYSQELSKTLKGGLGSLSDNLFTTFYTEPNKPSPPTMPVVTLSEMKIVGTLNKINKINVGLLYTPGSVNPPKYNPSIPSGPVDFKALPIYNEPLGLFALLETPKINYYKNLEESVISNQIIHKLKDYFKLGEILKYRFNKGVDFDYNKTESHCQFNIKINHKSIPYFEIKFENLKILHQYNDNNGSVTYELASDWYPIEMIGEQYFGFTVVSSRFGQTPNYDLTFEFVKLKIMNDMYFNQLSHDGKEINTTQVSTFELMRNNVAVDNSITIKTNILDVKKYNATKLVLENEEIEPTDAFVFNVIGNIIYIKQSEVVLKGNITVKAGYEVVIQSYWDIVVEPNCTIDPKINLEIKKDFYNFPITKEATNADLGNYCLGQNKKYKANQFSNSAPPIADTNTQTLKPKKVTYLSFNTVPNPSNSMFAINALATENGNYTVLLSDLLGKAVYKTDLTIADNKGDVSISTSYLSNGVYFLTISNGKQKLTKKLLVQHE